jgi:hypothetical protein
MMHNSIQLQIQFVLDKYQMLVIGNTVVGEVRVCVREQGDMPKDGETFIAIHRTSVISHAELIRTMSYPLKKSR